MHTTTFLQDLAVVMIVAGLVTVVFHRFKQPVVLGYIIAGVIIGPHTPPFPLIFGILIIEDIWRSSRATRCCRSASWGSALGSRCWRTGSATASPWGRS